MTENQKETLQAVIRTLDTIPVCGAQNMDKMLGCIRVLMDILNSETAAKNGA